MKILVNLARIITGLLFIFSGLVKANDPHGLSYKMQEYFEIWGVHGLNGYTLVFSVLMNAFEIIAGFALLIGWRIRLFSWLLLFLIVGFTFLTGYTYFTGKPTNCGCFGDCLPITSQTSFIKDIILTVLIVFLLFRQKWIRPVMSGRAANITMTVVIIFSFGFQWYCLNYLPVVDCLPYKKGNNITEKMQMPSNAIPDSTVITFVYEKAGKEISFTADKFPADFNGKDYRLIRRYDKVVRKGKNNEPPIKGFVLSAPTNTDSTAIVLSHPYSILLFCEDFSVPVSRWQMDFEKIYAAAKQKNIPVYLVTGHPGEAASMIASTGFSGIPVFKCDYKAILTAARVNPTLFLLKEGTITGKWSYRRMTAVMNEVEKIGTQPAPVVTPQVTTDSANLLP